MLYQLCPHTICLVRWMPADVGHQLMTGHPTCSDVLWYGPILVWMTGWSLLLVIRCETCCKLHCIWQTITHTLEVCSRHIGFTATATCSKFFLGAVCKFSTYLLTYLPTPVNMTKRTSDLALWDQFSLCYWCSLNECRCGSGDRLGSSNYLLLETQPLVHRLKHNTTPATSTYDMAAIYTFQQQRGCLQLTKPLSFMESTVKVSVGLPSLPSLQTFKRALKMELFHRSYDDAHKRQQQHWH